MAFRTMPRSTASFVADSAGADWSTTHSPAETSKARPIARRHVGKDDCFFIRASREFKDGMFTVSIQQRKATPLTIQLPHPKPEPRQPQNWERQMPWRLRGIRTIGGLR